MGAILVAIGILIITAGFFSGTETGLISLNRIHLQHQTTGDNRRARRLKKLLEAPDKAITMFLVGTNLSIVSATSLATYLAMNTLPFDKDICAFLASCIMTPTILVFAEIIPKVLFRIRADALMYTLSGAVTTLYRLLLPVVYIFSSISGGLIWLLRGGKRMPLVSEVDREALRSREDLRLLIKLSEEEGILEEDEERMIYSVFDFGTMSAREIMTPRVDMVAVEENTPIDEIIDILVKAGYSRMPIYKENLDQIVGTINAFDILNVEELQQNVTGLLRPAKFVPETMRVSILLEEFQKSKTHLAVVVDEYGGTAGLVTLEDILEEIVGEIEDEFDKTASRVRMLKDGSFLLDGRFSLHDVNQDFDLNLPTGDDVDSIGGFLVSELERVPEENEQLTFENVVFSVVKSDGKKVVRVKMRFLEVQEDEDRQEQTREDLDGV